MRRPPVAVILFPGTNCEAETARVLDAAGMEASIVRWNERLDGRFAAYVLPGGWSYEDRIRAGAIAAHDDVMHVVRAEADRGKPVLGICNGAQILAEADMVPGPGAHHIALTPNVAGYRCAWVHVRLVATPAATAFTGAYRPGDVVALPVAHGEGRFVTSDLESAWLEQHAVFRYCTSSGAITDRFPENPNGSRLGVAGIANARGNVLALMPHPERASWWWQHPPNTRPAGATSDPPARRLFQSLCQSIGGNR